MEMNPVLQRSNAGKQQNMTMFKLFVDNKNCRDKINFPAIN